MATANGQRASENRVKRRRLQPESSKACRPAPTRPGRGRGRSSQDSSGAKPGDDWSERGGRLERARGELAAVLGQPRRRALLRIQRRQLSDDRLRRGRDVSEQQQATPERALSWRNRLHGRGGARAPAPAHPLRTRLAPRRRLPARRASRWSRTRPHRAGAVDRCELPRRGPATRTARPRHWTRPSGLSAANREAGWARLLRMRDLPSSPKAP